MHQTHWQMTTTLVRYVGCQPSVEGLGRYLGGLLQNPHQEASHSSFPSEYRGMFQVQSVDNQLPVQ